MPLNPEQLEEVVVALKRIATTELNLSDAQKEQLKTAMTQAREKLEEYRQQNPNVTRAELISKVADNRSAIRERVVAFLTPEQLTKWDTEVAKLRESLGGKAAGA
jgi:predicted HTH transcriptional regulator